MFVLPNRKAFSDSITRIFLKYRKTDVDPLDTADSEEDLCMRRGDMSKNTKELFSYQKIVREYLMMETPYRGLLLYHGLGSGKTCSSIAVAESLLSTKKCYILLPASLSENYKGEIRKCGDPIYAFEQYWEPKSITKQEDVDQAKSMGISQKFLDTNGRFYVTSPERQPNFRTLPLDVQKGIRAQIDDILDQRFTFINYNGISSSNIDTILPPDNPQQFDDTVVIIDEAHNLINYAMKQSLRSKIYDRIYNARNCKVVCLSGTPVINRPQEIAYLMNLLRGPIERISIPSKSATQWDEALMTGFFRQLKDVDTIEYNSVKRTIMLTRNPPYFESQYNEKGERIAVKYNKDVEQNPDMKAWVATWKSKFETTFAGIEFPESDRMVIEKLELLPTDFEEFMKLFVDGLSIKNSVLFGRRIQGLVSYFKGADERLLPKRLDEDKTLVKVPMSNEQFQRYLETRWVEVQRESRKSRSPNLNDDFGSFRMTSRLACNYAIPPELRTTMEEGATEETIVEKSDIIEKLKSDPARYLSEEALAKFSPKMLAMLKDIKNNIGESGSFNNQFIYSQYRSLEGIGVFTAVLVANGFQEYKLVKKGGVWSESSDMKPGVPAYGVFLGGAEEERELHRQIFNQDYSDTFPQSLKDSIKEHRLCIFLGSRAAAEGITLADVRRVHIMEPYWNPALIEQVIGRAIRICSHRKLPLDQRDVVVKLYMSVFTPEQSTTNEGFNIVPIRRNDMTLKRYEGDEPRETFMTSDEYLYETAYEKGRIVKNISLLLKQSAIDCEIHRRLHSKEKPVIQCMRFDTTSTGEDLAYKPGFKTDDLDTLYLRNVQRKTRRLQIVKAKGLVFVIDPDTNEVFDAPAFQDTQRLVRLGIRSAPGEIRFFTSVVS
uniref:Helicase ATP-binding domain-containing protein n=1 Tax=viral metagenome TaxID=1070528 RepID=A0A6C0EQI7_9ZZZZ